MHLVKLGANKGVRTWDPQGCVWARKSMEGDVLHGQNVGYPPDGYQIVLNTRIASTVHLKGPFP